MTHLDKHRQTAFKKSSYSERYSFKGFKRSKNKLDVEEIDWKFLQNFVIIQN